MSKLSLKSLLSIALNYIAFTMAIAQTSPAGNAMTTSVVGAVVTGLLIYALALGKHGQQLGFV